MPRPANELEQIAHRRQQVAELYLRGWGKARIAAKFNVHRTTIVRDIQAIHRQWVESAIGSLDEYKQREVRRHLWIIEQATDQWERSKQQAVKREKGTGANGEFRKTTKSEQCGDPKYLAVIQSSSEAIARLLGLHEASKHEHTMGETNERRDRLASILAVLNGRSAN